MSLQSISALLAAIITFVIGGSVLMRDRRHRVYITFAILCFNLCFWYLSSFFATTLSSDGLVWLSLVFGVAVPTSTERFFRVFLADDPRRPEPRSRIILAGTILAYLLLLYAGLFYPLHTHLLFTVPLWVFVFASLYYCVFLLYRRQRATRSRPEAMRMIYLFWGGAAAVTLAAVDFLPRAGVAFPTLGNVLTVIYMYFISQTLFHFRLLDIKELLGKMITLSALVLILTIIYGVLLSWVGRDRPGVFFFNTVVASFVILVLFEQLRGWVEDRVTRWMFREKYEFSRRLQLLRYDLANIIDVQTLVTRILGSLEESERVTHASIYLADVSGANYRLAGHVGPAPVDHLEGGTRMLFLERLKDAGMLTLEGLEQDLSAQTADGQDDEAVATRNLQAAMEEMHSSVCIPLVLDGQLLGLLNLRDDRLREAYASDELNGLRRLAAQAVITLRNSKSYEAMKERDRLAALGQMAAGLAHEIRNPLGAIKGAAQLLKTALDEQPSAAPIAADGEDDREQQDDVFYASISVTGGDGEEQGRGDDAREDGAPGDEASEHEEEVGEYLGIIVEEVNRLGRVVTQFLGYARPDRAERTRLDVNNVVDKTLQLLRPQADGVTIKGELADRLPPIQADPEQLRQVFLNLGINGIQSMNGEGELRIATRLRRGTRRGKAATFVEVSFHDTGAGIAPEAISDIFIPFYTTKDRGTGLGLPICQRIVEAHKGTIEVRSQAGKGSTFAVLIPSAADLTVH